MMPLEINSSYVNGSLERKRCLLSCEECKYDGNHFYYMSEYSVVVLVMPDNSIENRIDKLSSNYHRSYLHSLQTNTLGNAFFLLSLSYE